MDNWTYFWILFILLIFIVVTHLNYEYFDCMSDTQIKSDFYEPSICELESNNLLQILNDYRFQCEIYNKTNHKQYCERVTK